MRRADLKTYLEFLFNQANESLPKEKHPD